MSSAAIEFSGENIAEIDTDILHFLSGASGATTRRAAALG